MSRRLLLVLQVAVASVVLIGGTLYFFSSSLSKFSPDRYVHRPALEEIFSGSPSNHDASSEKRAYATFLATRLQDIEQDDPYFTAVRVLNYQLQYSLETRTKRSIPFVVLVAPFVSEEKRAVLVNEGALVIEVALLEPENATWIHPSEKRFADQFTKLRLFEQTQFSQILYMDADMLLQRSLDDIWDEPVAQQILPTLATSDATEPGPQNLDGLLPSNYSLVGVSDTGGANHPFPPPVDSRLNGGFFMLRPSVELFNYYVTILNVPGLFNTGLMEQSLLNYAHRAEGRMPWHAFEPGKWNVNWPRLRDVQGGAATLHDKFWEPGNGAWIERELVERWWRVQGRMEGYWQKHNSDNFGQMGTA